MPPVIPPVKVFFVLMTLPCVSCVTGLQVGVGGIKTLGQAKAPMTMDEILQARQQPLKQHTNSCVLCFC